MSQIIDAEQAAMEAIFDEYSDCFEDIESDKVNAAMIKSVRASLKAAKKQPKYYEDYIPVWEDIDKHAKEQEKTKEALKTAIVSLTTVVRQKYDTLVESEIRDLVFEDKWMCAINKYLKDLISDVQKNIVSTIEDLNERYCIVLSEMEFETNHYRTLVSGFLKDMGISL